jgi:phage gpG-like protein
MGLPTAPIEVDELRGALAGMVNDLNHDPFTEALLDCRDPIGRGVAEIFIQKEGSSGERWPEHAPATIARYGPHELLILLGILVRSVTESGEEGHIERIEDRSLTWGTDLIYAATHQYGDMSRNIPQREFLYLNDKIADECQEIISDYIDRNILS